MMKYFTNSIDYPKVFQGEILPPGELWCYISSTFLDGFINYGEHLKAYLLNRHTPWNNVEEFDGPCMVRINAEGLFEEKQVNTKKELFDLIVANSEDICNFSIGMFKDDALILKKS